MKCELCQFNNPKGTATAVIIKDNKLLVLKRSEEPFKGMWDLPGGFMHAGENPKETIRREIKEELGVDANEAIFMKSVPGTAFWKGDSFSIISSFYLIDIGNQTIHLNEENSESRWIALKELDPKNIAFDSNISFASWLTSHFIFDLNKAKELVRQLDSSANVNEHSLYKAMLNGYVARRYDEKGELIGMGWIFPRQTALRKQAVVEDMIVDENHRGKGLGREILHDLIQWAAREGIEVVELTSNPKRIAANELYKKYGFKLHPTNHYLYDIHENVTDTKN